MPLQVGQEQAPCEAVHVRLCGKLGLQFPSCPAHQVVDTQRRSHQFLVCTEMLWRLLVAVARGGHGRGGDAQGVVTQLGLCRELLPHPLQ